MAEPKIQVTDSPTPPEIPSVIKKTLRNPFDPAAAEVVLSNVTGTSSKAQIATFDHLSKQQKVMVMMELHQGEPPYHQFTINDVVYIVKRGVPQLVPMDVATMLAERLASENKLHQISVQMMDKMVKGGADA